MKNPNPLELLWFSLKYANMVVIDNEKVNSSMRIAIAGSGGLAQIFAHYINETVNPFIILSRQVSGLELSAFGTEIDHAIRLDQI